MTDDDALFATPEARAWLAAAQPPAGPGAPDDLDELRARLRKLEGAKRTTAAGPDADELQARLDRIVSFLAVKHDFQGHGAAWAATVVRIARGEETAEGKPAP